MRPSAHTNATADDRERGAVLVETALVMAVLVMLCFGALEYGLGWQVSNQAVAASRSGSRVAAGLGDDQTADYYAVTSVRASLESAGLADDIERVVIYKAPSGGRPPASCLAASPSGACNVYPADEIATMTLADFRSDGCHRRATPRNYCPTSRNVDQRDADSVGVFVVLNDQSVTGMFPDRVVNRRSVMRIEPTTTGG